MMTTGAIPTEANPKRVPFGGGELLVRRATRSVRDKIMAASDYNTESAGSAAMLTQLAIRWGVVGVDGIELRHAETGSPLEFKRAPSPGLGKIATEPVYDALDRIDGFDDVAAEIVDIAIGTGAELTEEQRGN